MEDLEICKRIAEIDKGDEFIEVYEDEYDGICLKEVFCGCIVSTRYNPLTDDGLCFQLMIKYEVDLISPYRPNGETEWECMTMTKQGHTVNNIYDESPNKAICLAIIEANKEK